MSFTINFFLFLRCLKNCHLLVTGIFSISFALALVLQNKLRKEFPSRQKKNRILPFQWNILGTNISVIRQCRSKIRLHFLCSLIFIYTVHERPLIRAWQLQGKSFFSATTKTRDYPVKSEINSNRTKIIRPI